MKFECKLMIWLAMLILAGCAGSNSSLKDEIEEELPSETLDTDSEILRSVSLEEANTYMNMV